MNGEIGRWNSAEHGSSNSYIVAMQANIIHPNKIRQVLFLILLLLLGTLLLQQLYGFLPALLGAITLYVICRKAMFQLVYKRKWKPGAAASLIMVLTLLIILVPIWVLV